MRVRAADRVLNPTRTLMALLILFATLPASHAQKQSAVGKIPSLQDFLIRYLGAPESKQDRTGTRYLSATADLNSDGHPETIVYLLGPGSCGSGGCTMLILTLENSHYKVLGESSVTRLPIRLLPTQTNGWHDIGVFVAGGGIRPGYEAKLSSNGSKYPQNPTIPPAHKLQAGAPGSTLIAAGAESQAKPVYR